MGQFQNSGRSESKSKRIIAALDCDNAVEVAEKIGEYVHAFKVNYPLVLRKGIGVIGEISKFGSVIADFKIADVPHISSQIAECAFKSGAKGVIVHAFVGSDTVKEVVKVAERYDRDVYAVVELSSEGGKEFMSRVAEELVKLARDAGCKGIVAPATRTERIRKLKKVAGDMVVITPGVGAQGGSAREAIKAGADYIIVGRSIYLGDPIKNVLSLLESLE